jgi:hypothetical protein
MSRHISNRTVVYISNMSRYVWQNTGPATVEQWQYTEGTIDALVQTNWNMTSSVVRCKCRFASSTPVLARIYGSSSKLLQGNVSTVNKLPSTRWTLWKTFFAAAHTFWVEMPFTPNRPDSPVPLTNSSQSAWRKFSALCFRSRLPNLIIRNKNRTNKFPKYKYKYSYVLRSVKYLTSRQTLEHVKLTVNYIFML